MLKHIVMWKFLPEAQGHTAQENMDITADKLKALLPIIPEIKSFEIGKDALHSEMSYDMALIKEFESFGITFGSTAIVVPGTIFPAHAVAFP